MSTKTTSKVRLLQDLKNAAGGVIGTLVIGEWGTIKPAEKKRRLLKNKGYENLYIESGGIALLGTVLKY